MSREERDSLLSAPAAGAGAPPPAFSVAGFFSHCKSELEYYFFDIRAVCRRGDYAALKRFVDAHPDPELLRRMANRLDIINHPPLYEIVMSNRSLGHYACAQLLLRLGADSNFSEKSDPLDSLLRNAIAYSTVEMAALLAQHKAEFKKDAKGKILGLESLWDKKIAATIELVGKKPKLDFIAEIEAATVIEEEHETHTESKKER